MTRKPFRRMLLPLLALALPPAVVRAEPTDLPVGGFAFTVETTVPGSPEEVWDAFTAHTLEWWDHSFSEHPVKMYFDTKPGGGFWEIFDESGDGVRHAEIIYADRGKRLRFTGPLGLSGFALDLVHTLDFAAVEGGTKLTLSVRAFGELQDGWPAVVEKTWRHFILERFQPYLEGTLE